MAAQSTIKITEKAVATVPKEDLHVLITQTENGVVSLRRMPLASLVPKNTVCVDADGRFYVEED